MLSIMQGLLHSKCRLSDGIMGPSASGDSSKTISFTANCVTDTSSNVSTKSATVTQIKDSEPFLVQQITQSGDFEESSKVKPTKLLPT